MKIMLPVDGTELSQDEVRFAMRLASEGLRASFLLVNVQEPATLYEIVTARDSQVLENVAQGAGEHALAPALALLAGAGLACETVMMTGNPAHALVDLAEEHGCDLIVLGHRNGALRSSSLGLVTQSLVHDSS